MKNKLSCLIIDDEPRAQQVLETFVGRVPYLQLLRKCNDAYAAIEAIHELSPDIIFLDINMPEMTGIELLKSFGKNRPKVILTTAYSEYALEGFEYEVTDYLLKPIPFDRFLRAVNRVWEGTERAEIPADKPESTPGTSQDSASIWVKEGKKMIHLNVYDILYVEGMKDYVKLHLAHDKMIVTYLTMSKVEEMLPPKAFLRVNRSYIVRMSAVQSVDGNTIETINKKEIPIGFSYRETVREIMNDRFLKR
ncbi:LytTR family DNA-binding domain-containing protein [Rhabdobacter roseus]|uniref:DNA-binding LytR/AlgR family response regulator n=1 Tax=Rhabdobacter roseus TaxID=1655419 RepID=A0A840U4E2_9BACT|nr:LytTR family DNA-binding domain-containing protein [Rhabdobacter roseus]MBB5287198.1 DNA-binding LytR/AlgR family response regulator [Rhabdobacter roseus]